MTRGCTPKGRYKEAIKASFNARVTSRNEQPSGNLQQNLDLNWDISQLRSFSVNSLTCPVALLIIEKWIFSCVCYIHPVRCENTVSSLYRQAQQNTFFFSYYSATCFGSAKRSSSGKIHKYRWQVLRQRPLLLHKTEIFEILQCV
jgi:hypothetical protein